MERGREDVEEVDHVDLVNSCGEQTRGPRS